MAITLPILAVVAAANASTLGIGLFNRLDWPLWLDVILAVLALDMTTAQRIHPVEIIASAALKVGLEYLFGPSALAVLVFNVLQTESATFNHANLALLRWLDRLVRLKLVTQDMHRTRHLVQREKHDSIFGFILSVWGRLFRTRRPQPVAGHETRPIGLERLDDRPV